MKAYLKQIEFICTITFVLISLISGQNHIQASIYTHSELIQYFGNNKSKGQKKSNQQNKPRPRSPDNGTPKGHSTLTTTRPQAMCKVTNKPLTAINANNGKDFTVSEFPSFWFYIPYSRQEIKSLEFVINNEKETKTIYATSVQLLDKPGVIKITIPSKQDYSLKINETYRWYLNLKCKQNTENEPDQVVNGWVKRIALDSKLEKDLTSLENQKYIAYKRHYIWHDYISNLANLHFDNPGNIKFNSDWNELLKSIQKEWVSQEKFVDSQTLDPSKN